MCGMLYGTLVCRRCGRAAEACCQTKDIAALGGDLYGERRVGDGVEVDNWADFYRLRAWEPPGPVRAVLGTASCRLCGTPNQWLTAHLHDVEPAPGGGVARAALGAVTTFDAADPAAFAHVEYVCEGLAEFANYRGGGSYTYPPPAFAVPPDRVPSEIAAGYARWVEDYDAPLPLTGDGVSGRWGPGP